MLKQTKQTKQIQTARNNMRACLMYLVQEDVFSTFSPAGINLRFSTIGLIGRAFIFSTGN